MEYGILVDVVLGCMSGTVQAEDQTVHADVARTADGVVLSMRYGAEAPLTGLGLRLHYDSSRLRYQGLRDVLQTGLLSSNVVPQADKDDGDGDPRTDKIWLLAWVDLMSGQ